MMRGSVVATVALAILLGTGAAPASAAEKQSEAKRSPAQVIADAQSALDDLSSFTVTGSVPSDGKMVGLDLVVTRGNGGGGTIKVDGALDFVVVGPSIYVRGDEAFWKKDGGAPPAQAALIAGKWLRASTTNKQMAKIAQYADVKYWSKEFYKGGGKLTKGSQRVLDGAPVVAVHDASGKNPGTLLVAATGKPLPVALIFDGHGPNARIALGNFDSATPPPAPTGAIDLPNS